MKRVKTLIVMLTLAVFAQCMLQAETPTARITEGRVTLAEGATNATSDVWLQTGEPQGSGGVVSRSGKGYAGAGVVRALIYKSPDSATNAVVRFYAYDSGIESSLYTVTGILVAGSERYNLTNDVFSGRLRVRITQDPYTNAACVWPVSAIVQ